MSRFVPRAALAAVAAAVCAVALAACAPEPEAAPTSGPSPSPSATATPTPQPTPTATPAALPADCRQIYSADMLASLDAQNPPLNDPAITLLSTDQAPLLELLDTVPTLRCTWGAPSDFGLSTNVSILDSAQFQEAPDTLAQAGFGCESVGEATICRIEQRGVSLDDVEYVRGETHAFEYGVWVATNWINFAPEGYSEDILDTLVG